MPNPKRRHSRSRSAKRQATQKRTPPPLVRCSNCGVSIRPHHVCAGCGYYRGRQMIVGKTA
jgi:large subunit ribosomal protein L32